MIMTYNFVGCLKGKISCPSNIISCPSNRFGKLLNIIRDSPVYRRLLKGSDRLSISFMVHPGNEKLKEVLQSRLTSSVCKSVCKTSDCLAFRPNCGDSRSRTDDPLLAKQVL